MPASRLNSPSWAATIRLLFHTPAAPVENTKNKKPVVEISLMEIPPSKKMVSRNSFDSSNSSVYDMSASSDSPLPSPSLSASGQGRRSPESSFEIEA